MKQNIYGWKIINTFSLILSACWIKNAFCCYVKRKAAHIPWIIHRFLSANFIAVAMKLDGSSFWQFYNITYDINTSHRIISALYKSTKSHKKKSVDIPDSSSLFTN